MAKEASAETDIVPRCAIIVLALDAFRDARYSEALLWTERVNDRSSLTSVVRAAALGELGSEQAPSSIGDGGINAVVFKRTVNAAGLPPDLVSMLERGVTKAGVDLDPVGSIRGSSELDKNYGSRASVFEDPDANQINVAK
ncbi:hypothetical protein [Rhizobium sp. S163]|uniref:hypothetical protein n=1 Tax=Rhizobium sp. S163 TaxID=3055039 RepID=UPI0025A99BD5|nr:hypothetical protein [Rhizobium sp. S163]MDM9646777.1 hypothetical protein [Rhizobium sp. S163]